MANTLFDALTATRQDPDQTFLIIPGAEDWSWGRFTERAAQYAQVLVAAGVTKGDRVAVQVTKSADAYALYLGCLQCGAAFLPMNTAYTATEILFFIKDAEPAVFVCDPAKEADLLQALAAELHQPVVMTLDADGQGSLTTQADQAPGRFDTVAVAGDELAAILYTSGTTGRSKGAML
nr:AMP-binding protein [Gammaproteobacteria bacterium]